MASTRRTSGCGCKWGQQVDVVHRAEPAPLLQGLLGTYALKSRTHDSVTMEPEPHS